MAHRGGGGGGGGGGTASLKLGTYCQTTAPVFSALSAPQPFFTAPLFFRVLDHPLQKSNIIKTN